MLFLIFCRVFPSLSPQQKILNPSCSFVPFINIRKEKIKSWTHSVSPPLNKTNKPLTFPPHYSPTFSNLPLHYYPQLSDLATSLSSHLATSLLSHLSYLPRSLASLLLLLLSSLLPHLSHLPSSLPSHLPQLPTL